MRMLRLKCRRGPTPKLKKGFKSKEVCAMGVSWKKYKKDFEQVSSVSEANS